MTPSQVRAARGLLDWSQKTLADAAGVGLSTIVDLERERRAVSQELVAVVRAALTNAGIEFIDANGGGAGVRLRKPSHGTKRGRK